MKVYAIFAENSHIQPRALNIPCRNAVIVEVEAALSAAEVRVLIGVLDKRKLVWID